MLFESSTKLREMAIEQEILRAAYRFFKLLLPVAIFGPAFYTRGARFKSHLTSRMSNRAINERAYSVAYECKNCGDLPETTSFKSYAAKHEQKSQPIRSQLSLLDVQQSVRGYSTSPCWSKN